MRPRRLDCQIRLTQRETRIVEAATAGIAFLPRWAPQRPARGPGCAPSCQGRGAPIDARCPQIGAARVPAPASSLPGAGGASPGQWVASTHAWGMPPRHGAASSYLCAMPSGDWITPPCRCVTSSQRGVMSGGRWGLSLRHGGMPLWRGITSFRPIAATFRHCGTNTYRCATPPGHRVTPPGSCDTSRSACVTPLDDCATSPGHCAVWKKIHSV